MFDLIADDLPELAARMGRLTLDSSVRECLSIREAWKGISFRLELAAGFAADEASDVQVYWEKAKEADDLRDKFTATPQFRNYAEVTQDLFGLKQLRERKDNNRSAL